MCFGCWMTYGRPTIVTAQTMRVAELCKKLYAHPDGGSGGRLHIITDDWNLEDEFFEDDEVASEEVVKDDRDPELVAVEDEIEALLTPMNLGHRAAALGLWQGFFEVPPGLEIQPWDYEVDHG